MSESGRDTRARHLARVVVIDDHPFFRDGLSRGLRQSGYLDVVGEAGTGREGLELIRELEPNVAVLDYQMPDLDGLDVVHAIVRDGLPTRALILSALTDSAVVFVPWKKGRRGICRRNRGVPRSSMPCCVWPGARPWCLPSWPQVWPVRSGCGRGGLRRC
jgi:two-component system, NarL family, nitrate/nitrite response regulator NarL